MQIRLSRLIYDNFSTDTPLYQFFCALLVVAAATKFIASIQTGLR
ncbi:hypothetical protein AFEL58S_00846 [Afipia felis]